MGNKKQACKCKRIWKKAKDYKWLVVNPNCLVHSEPQQEKEPSCIHGHPKGYGCDERCKQPIQKLPKRRSVKLSSTVAGQRELIREMRNKLDEVIDAVNELRGDLSTEQEQLSGKLSSWEEIKNKYSQSGWFDNIDDIKELDKDVEAMLANQRSEIVEFFDIELEAWMEAHSKQDRSFDTQSLVKHMKKALKEKK